MRLGAAIVMSAWFATAASASATERWREGFGQGVLEAWVEKGPGNEIRVACESGFGRPITGISFSLSGKGPASNSVVTLIFDDQDPKDFNVNQQGEISSNCRACAANFEVARDALKSGKSVYVRFSDGVGTRFSLTGAAKAIGKCEADFWKTF